MRNYELLKERMPIRLFIMESNIIRYTPNTCLKTERVVILRPKGKCLSSESILIHSRLRLTSKGKVNENPSV